jgi:hypothetical protein
VTPELAAAGAARALVVLEDAWTTDPRVLGRARALGLSGWTFHLAGRVGVLGEDIHPETLFALLGTVSPEAVRTGWAAARRVGPGMVATARLTECADWGADRLGEVAGAGLAELMQCVVDGADATAMPVFAAIRRMVATFSDAPPGGRVALLSHALAEHRWGAMLVAFRAVGLTPVEALVAGPEGEQEAIASGWSPPFPARLPVLRRYAAAGVLADRITGAAYAALGTDKRVRLVDCLNMAANAAAAASRSG